MTFARVSPLTSADRSVLLTPSMALQTHNKRALVAGGTGRIGRAIAARLESEGWQVVAAGAPTVTSRRSTAPAASSLARSSELGGLDLVVNSAATASLRSRSTT